VKKMKQLVIAVSLTTMALGGVVVINSPEEDFPPYSVKQ
jgi:hypothetical protein